MLPAAGLAVVPVQLGSNTLAIPTGVTLWCDIEWVPSAIPTNDDALIAYVEAWADAVIDGGYSAGLYVGPNTPLSGSQLYSISGIKHYWKSASRVPWVSTRGFQIMQSLYLTDNVSSNGITIDADVIAYDAKGELPVWVSPS